MRSRTAPSLLVALLAASAAVGCWGARRPVADGHVKVAQPPSRPVLVQTPPAPRGLVALDFGDAVSWEGFVSVPGDPNVTVSDNARFGIDASNDGDFPDPLVGDFVTADEFTVTVSGIERGSCRAAVIAQNVGLGMVPAKDFSVEANGRAVIDVKVTPEWYFSPDGFFRGVRNDDLSGSHFWRSYIEPVAPWRTFRFDSRGDLTLKLTNCRLYALVIAPENDVTDSDLSAFLEATQAARQAYFLFNRFKLAPQIPQGKMPDAANFAERGYAVFARHWGDHVTYNTLPRPEDLTTTLDAAGTPGERVPVTFCVRTLRPLEAITVTASDLSAAGGKTIPASAVSVQSVRYLLRRSGEAYDAFPEVIQTQGDISLPDLVTKCWWLTVTVPDSAEPGTYAGQVRFTPKNTQGAVLTLKLEVYPFKLARLTRSAGVWYGDPRDYGYRTSVLGGPDRSSDLDRAVETYRVRMLEADIRCLSEHGFNGITVPAPAVVSVSASGKVALDFSALEPYRALLKKYSINTAFPGQTFLLDVSDRILQFRPDGAPLAEFSDLHRKAYKDAVAQIRDWWKEAGILILAHAVHEPRDEDPGPSSRSLRATREYLKLIREVGGFPSTVTTVRDVQDGQAVLPVYEAEDVIQSQPSPLAVKAVLYSGQSAKPLRFYDTVGFTRYGPGFYSWARRSEGWWQWHFDARFFSWNPFWDAQAGCGVFPSPDGPVPTVRFERASQGLYDYRYALTLEDYVARARASYAGEAVKAAREGQALLDSIRKGTTLWALDKNHRHVQVSNDKLTQWRSRIAHEIMKIQAALQ